MDRSPEQVWYEYVEKLFNERNTELVEVLFAPDYVLNGETYNYQQVRSNLQTLFTAFPDCYLTIDKEFTRGITVVCDWTLRGTHLGEYRGIPPSGAKVRVQGKSEVSIYRGKIIKQWREMDEQSLRKQIEQHLAG
jgi:predicted ester cyclase